ncbi:methyltransferase [Saccharopolyspora hattusasensis]|uniref:methyltransferase n=1 Tax=Saccharopolyspora hattusasensis TaxID=1128679 RepID=UPI003D97FC8A
MDTSEEIPYEIVMRQLLLGRLVSSALHAAVVLRIPDVVHEDPCTAEELAVHLDVNEPALRRLVRVLINLEVISEDPANGVLTLTPLGNTLRENVPGTARHSALLVGGPIGRCWDHLLAAVRTGEPAFDATFGVDVFSYLDGEADLQGVFYRSQAADLEITLAELVVVGWESYRTVVDVGGGDGALLEHVLTACPESRGVVLETASVAQLARSRMAAAGLAQRCEVVIGDFFESVPSGGDLYVLRDVVHDWPDERCAALLRVEQIHADLGCRDLPCGRAHRFSRSGTQFGLCGAHQPAGAIDVQVVPWL